MEPRLGGACPARRQLRACHENRRPVRKASGVFAGIYGIVDRSLVQRPVVFLEQVLAGGIRVVQYRAKSGVDREVVRAMLMRTRAAGAILIVNDDFEAALEADGWHAGQEDLEGRDPSALRARLGWRTFGVSCGTPREALAAEAIGADYAGVGPFAGTATKADAGPAIGEAGVRAVVAATRLPVVAIGGIDAQNLAEVKRTGAAMAAIVSALTRASDPRAAAADLIARWKAPATP
jgi:thiamine-phosphate diphosphorylase